ncbi:18473_t:CDS:1, partial [Acaulospora morrowiae]
MNKVLDRFGASHQSRQECPISQMIYEQSLEKWLLGCYGLPITFRNKSDRQLRDYLIVM